jgi:plastocyanin
MQRRTFVLAGTLLSAVVLGGGAILAAQTGDTKVHIDNFAFGPARITVAPGTKVTWDNRDDIPHTVTDAAEPREFKSAALDTGDAFSHVFSLPGTYRYFCSLHPHMQGTVVVK